MNNLELESLINEYLKPHLIKDYCPNGLQVEGQTEITKIITGVSACKELIDQAIEKKAQAILVHHGYFWRGESESIRGMKYQRIKALIENGINLYAYHLPLDIHPTLGNNVLLGKMLDIEFKAGMETGNPNSIPVWGELAEAITAEDFATKIETVLNRKPLLIKGGKHLIKRIGWCTGGAQDYIDLAASLGLDAFISGEISERTTFSAREQGIHYFAAGHHATERCGIQALGEWIAKEQGIEVEFVDIENPV